SERVLIACVADELGVGVFNSAARELVCYLAAGRIRIFGEDIAVAESWNVQLLDFVVNGNRRSANSDRIDHDVVREQHPEYVLVAGIAAILAAIADHEDHLAAGFVALGEIKGGLE